jgi:hypothetical protein
MKRTHFGVLILALCLGGCAAPEFQPYPRHGVVTKGMGGAVARQNGMDVWTNGSPARPYRVLGFVEKEGDRHATQATVLRDCLAIAKSHGGTGVLLLESDSRIPGAGLRSGSFLGRAHVKVAVLRYL